MGKNPFTPTFGIVPAHLAGRRGVLKDMRQAFENGLGDPNLSTILIGARGTGKTALLSCIADEAQQRGWIVVNVAAGKGMLEDDGPSRGSDIARRLGKGTNYVSTYKRRALKQGVIEELPDGTFEICIPFFEDYLRDLKE